MSTLVLESDSILAQSVSVTADALVVELVDGRSLSVPLAWYPRLHRGTQEERNNWRLIGGGDGVHWPDLDEDISMAGLVAGRPSGESPRSLDQWIKARG
jgi:hypothetical protein